MTMILIAEDNELNRELLVTVLKFNGFSTITANDGAEAVSIAKRELPALILMDIQMPKLDGFDALNLLKSSTDTSNIPVIAITGNVMPHDLDRIIKSGFYSIIHKPYKIDELLKAVNLALKSS